MTIEVFRTHKGDQEKGVAGTITLVNPDPSPQNKNDVRVSLPNFLAKKFATDVHMIPRHFITAGSDGKAETIDLFRTEPPPGKEPNPYLVSDDGRLEIRVQCLERQQYYGMAQADLYIRAADSSFAWNFCKGYLGIWLQMALVVSLGVMFSTFVSGPVALLATLFVIIVGIFSGYLVELAGGKMVGGGPFESMQRIMTQDNMISELEPGVKTNVIKAHGPGDGGDDAVFLRGGAECLRQRLRRPRGLRLQRGPDLVARCLLCEAAYLLPVILLGYVCLKQREMAQ